jgi:hypothetical protein
MHERQNRFLRYNYTVHSYIGTKTIAIRIITAVKRPRIDCLTVQYSKTGNIIVFTKL